MDLSDSPGRPACPSRASGWSSLTTPWASRVARAFLVYMLSPLPRHSDWDLPRSLLPSRVSLPRYGSRVGLRIVLFEACAAFTRVTACTLALSPICDTHSEGFSYFVTSIAAPLLPAGAVAGWDLHPLESAAFPRRTPDSDILNGTQMSHTTAAVASIAAMEPLPSIRSICYIA
jgi:hypothetical protein